MAALLLYLKQPNFIYLCTYLWLAALAVANAEVITLQKPKEFVCLNEDTGTKIQGSEPIDVAAPGRPPPTGMLFDSLREDFSGSGATPSHVVPSLNDPLENVGATWCLFMSNEEKSWSDSRQYCRDHGGDLVIINTEEKQRFVSSFVKERVWIGLSDLEEEGNMKWVNNSPLKQGFWARGEPNDLDGNEDCIEIVPEKPILNNWNDLPCSVNRKEICEASQFIP